MLSSKRTLICFSERMQNNRNIHSIWVRQFLDVVRPLRRCNSRTLQVFYREDILYTIYVWVSNENEVTERIELLLCWLGPNIDWVIEEIGSSRTNSSCTFCVDSLNLSGFSSLKINVITCNIAKLCMIKFT